MRLLCTAGCTVRCLPVPFKQLYSDLQVQVDKQQLPGLGQLRSLQAVKIAVSPVMKPGAKILPEAASPPFSSPLRPEIRQQQIIPLDNFHKWGYPLRIHKTPKNTTIFSRGATKKVPPMVGNPYFKLRFPLQLARSGCLELRAVHQVNYSLKSLKGGYIGDI